MAKITTLFVDIGGVLLTNGWDREDRSLASKKFGLNLEEMESRHRLTFDTFEIGKISLEEYLKRVVFYEKRSFSQEEFQKFMMEQSSPYPEMLELIQSVKKKHHLKVVAVNNEAKELNVHRIKEFKLGTIIDFFVSSCFVHLRKPDDEIYRLALDFSQASPEEVLYIEDREMFVQIAESLGIKGLHHKDFASTQDKIVHFFAPA
jgi:putative hydrolase of the HAD superfamily